MFEQCLQRDDKHPFAASEYPSSRTEQIQEVMTISHCGEGTRKENQCVRKSAKARLPRARRKAPLHCTTQRRGGAAVKASKADV